MPILGEIEYKKLQAELTAILCANSPAHQSLEPFILRSDNILRRVGLTMSLPMHSNVGYPKCGICKQDILPGQNSVPCEFGGRAHDFCVRQK